jgi:hypothetical protein
MAETIIRYAQYTEQDFDSDVNRAHQIGGSTMMELKQGENVVRFVPSKEPGISPMRPTGMHYVDSVPGLDRVIVFACPKKELNQPCAVCDAATVLMRSPNPIDRDRGDKWGAKLTLYANVIDRSAPADDPNHGLRVLRFGKTILEQLKTIRRSTRTGGDFFDPGPNGFDIVITREGENKTTKYKVIPDRQNSPMFQDVELAQAAIDNAYDLNSYVSPTVPEALLNAMDSMRELSGMGRQPAAALPPPARAASGALPPRQVTTTGAAAAVPGVRTGAGLFGAQPQPPSAGRTVAEADFTDEDDDDFGPPPKA